MKMPNKILLLFFVLIMISCNHTPQNKAAQTALNFYKAMYSLKLNEAKQYCTPEATKLVDFIASNIKETDFIKLKEAGDPEISVVESNINPGDSTATVKLKVSNYIQLNLLTGKSTIEKEKEDEVDLVKINDKWLVDLHK